MTLADDLRDLGYRVDDEKNPFAALRLFEKGEYDLVITDLKMPGMDGITLMKRATKIRPHCSFLVITAFGTVESAVEALKAGAFDYITKPFRIEEIHLLLRRLEERKTLVEENVRLKAEVAASRRFPVIIGKSPAIGKILDLVKEIAPSDTSILITGETGTGKEIIAEAIHTLSPRRDRPLVKVSCAALSRELLESELFGHVKGAFTGATSDKPGRFEMANGGTIFLDEVDDIPLDLQVKLLRFIQEKEIERVGSTRTRQLDVRIIAATKVDLHRRITEGRFRRDLYYRLNVVPIEIPPLRERKEDIPALMHHFSRKFTPERPLRFSEEVIEKFLSIPWEGNVRELENIMERLSLLCRCDPVTLECLPASWNEIPPHPTEEGGNLDELVNEYEHRLIEEALRRCGGNRKRASEHLGIPYSTLRSKIKKYTIE